MFRAPSFPLPLTPLDVLKSPLGSAALHGQHAAHLFEAFDGHAFVRFLDRIAVGLHDAILDFKYLRDADNYCAPKSKIWQERRGWSAADRRYAMTPNPLVLMNPS